MIINNGDKKNFMDFTIYRYKSLINALEQTYSFQKFSDFLQDPKRKTIILRHDVDLLPQNSLRLAKIQAMKGIRGSYYFRAVSVSWNETIIKEIASLGHEVGYHYETMDKAKGDIDKAWDQFRFHLDELRKLTEVKTICMHGSPRSKYDNKDLWKKYNYKSLGIIGEPYYDVNFNNIYYLTDTGRRWDGWKTSIRDKVPQQKDWIKKGLVFNSTNDIISASKNVLLPDQIMITFHPQRWNDKIFPWVKELILQSAKNQVKKALILYSS
jgi:hypothetical protein